MPRLRTRNVLPGLIFVLTGERGSGKSTVCARVAREAAAGGLTVAGILTERSGHSAGSSRQVLDLRTGEIRPFGSHGAHNPRGSRKDSDRTTPLDDPRASDPLTPGWEYDPGVFKWANEALLRSVPCDVLVIDEVGPLELLGGRGWAAALEILRSREFGAALVVCRPGLLRQLESYLGRPSTQTFKVEPGSREGLPSLIVEELERSLRTH